MFKSLSQYADLGLLLGRLGIGAIYIVFGWQKLSGGQVAWTHIGHAMAYLGIGFMPNVWGLLAALAEFLGGILLVLGFLFRPAATLILSSPMPNQRPRPRRNRGTPRIQRRTRCRRPKLKP